MRASEIRAWLGMHYLLLTGLLAAYITLFHGTRGLPVPQGLAVSCFQIITPVLVGQAVMVLRWQWAHDTPEEETIIAIGEWVVKGPPIVALLILLCAVSGIVLYDGSGQRAGITPQVFKTVITL